MLNPMRDKHEGTYRDKYDGTYRGGEGTTPVTTVCPEVILTLLIRSKRLNLRAV